MMRITSLCLLVLFACMSWGANLRADEAADEKRYVIIHADDAGMSHTVNLGTIESMEKGIVSSASIMVPCPWFSEYAAHAAAHPEGDYGIHLTLNSEWKHYRWGPVAPRERVPSLIDEDGYLWDNVDQVKANVKASEAEIELRAQIDRAREFGVPLSHLDTHMGAVISRPDLLEIYVKLGLEYNLPVLFFRAAGSPQVAIVYPALRERGAELLKQLDQRQLPVLDHIVQYYKDGTYDERKEYYLNVLRNLKPGVTQIIIHCGIDNPELKGITSSHHIRDTDRRIFMDAEVIAEIEKLGIEVIDWKRFRKMTSKRYVIIHADDAGMSHSVNIGTIEAMEKGVVSSASIMVPCPWFSEFAAYARKNPDKDYGIHLDLTSEWKHYRWGPVLPRSQVTSLVDKDGYLWNNNQLVAGNVKASEVEAELKAQIDRALKFGVPLSHLDTHMGALLMRPDLVETYVNLGIEYDLPVLFVRDITDAHIAAYPGLKGNLDQLRENIEQRGFPILDAVHQNYGEPDYDRRKAWYLNVLRNLRPGVSEIIIHCGVNNSELEGITSSSSRRDDDRRIFADPAVKAEIDQLGIEIITWKQFRDMARTETAEK